MNKKIFCSCCGRQIVFCTNISTDITAPGIGSVYDVGHNMICGDCAEDLDDNGCFPGEGLTF